MTKTCEDNLEQYCAQLCALADNSDEEGVRDEFAILVLRIVVALVDDNDFGRAVAKELSLILHFAKGVSAEDELASAMHGIDENLDESLRGFSQLMELILEDNRIRRDPLAALDAIRVFTPSLRASFAYLCRALTAVMELEEAFGLDLERPAAAIVVASLRDIKAQVFGLEKNYAEQCVTHWLEERVKNDALNLLYEHTKMVRQEFIDCAVFTPHVVVVVLCLWSADQRVLNHEEARLIDQKLCSLGMLGIKPLLEAGFLELEECAKGERSQLIVEM